MIDNLRELTPRPVRFPISTPMCYRIIGDKEWHDGTTLNISHKGILFKAETVIEPGTRIEIRFTLSVQSHPDAGTKVSCRGVVVRSSEQPILAARISAARINRRSG